MPKKIIRFIRNSGGYSSGERAGFPAEVADKAVKDGYAVYHEVRKRVGRAADEVKKQAQTVAERLEGESKEEKESRPAIGRGKQAKPVVDKAEKPETAPKKAPKAEKEDSEKPSDAEK